MAAEQELTPSSYIGHHLSFLQHPVGEGSFLTLNVDSLVTAVLLGVVSLWFLWWVLRGATSGVPNKRQAFVEILCEFVDNQAKDIFHGDRRFIAPVALTVGLWALLMNAMDFLPADIMAWITHFFAPHGFRIVPTADVNTTFAPALSVWVLIAYSSIAVMRLGGWIHELICTPLGAPVLMWLPIFASPL